jgi:hypothetical protein
MMNRVYVAFITFLSVAITLASNQAFGGSGAAPGGSSASTNSIFRPSVTRLPHHHNGRNIRALFPATGGFFWEPSNGFWRPSNGEPNVEVTQKITGDIYTCSYYLPWDWVHRCPPIASPPEPPPPPVVYAPACPTQTVTVPGADGKDQTVTMVRC